ncbi:glycosyltransferase [Treponema bryantii]|uniref:glycosyltransferase n=1 Tax=Treponema bryantii TaxID=163 RepID=UPI002B2CC498|nr:glycosyl transferase [Treponema bryantii]
MKVALVHYWLVTMRGGEKVLETLCKMFPEADIYTNVYNPDAVSDIIRSHKVYTTKINNYPMARKLYQKYMPFMPKALMELDLTGYDLIISSESGPAKGVCPAPDAFHICYCHTPMRYLWDMYHEYFKKSNPLVKFFMKKMIPGLRLWDISSSNLVDYFVANSHYVASRINRYYKRNAEVVYPPCAIQKYIDNPRNPEDFYLFFGQLVGYKRADLAIEACIKSGRKIVVIGDGKSKKAAEYTKSGLVTFTGRVSDQAIADYLSKARALLFPGIEDFGIIPVEANAAGCPVLAYKKGGALDSIKENVTGMFFDEQTTDSLIKCMDSFEKRQSDFNDRKAFTEHVQQFSENEFIKKINFIVQNRNKML